ncbi:class III extradiol dioxygenase subunit B-like domain-containing protein [Micromonospora sp. NPDC050397]|uniref:class III extradiol dioxygenase subunit B-like domain-containing protein n=1 Tax=Micromonospora sp. NPDC050397 TaxID=3364279 RepID=UPI00384F1E81
MSLVAAAVCPHPPMIVPEIAGSAAAELDELRDAADSAIARLLSVPSDAVLVVGGATRTEQLSPPYVGGFAPWGVAAEFALPSSQSPDQSPKPKQGPKQGPTQEQGPKQEANPDSGAGRRAGSRITPLSLLVGGWLLSRHDLGGRTVLLDAVSADNDAAECAEYGARRSEHRPRIALLVLGDGSARRGEKAPGYHDPRAATYDKRVASALAGADVDALLGLDPSVSARLWVAGRAAWQVLAGAAQATGTAWTADLSYSAAPYGVGYFVANWEREEGE